MALYDKKIVCLYCETDFKSKAVKTSSIRMDKADKDGCNIYNGKANPYFYQVFSCPNCGYVFTQGFSIIRNNKLDIQTNFLNRISFIDFCGERTIEDAIKVWKLALVSAQVSKQTIESMSGIALRIAWLYRHLDDYEREKVFLKKAKDGYIRAYRNEDLVNNPTAVVKVIFHACIKLKDLDEARVWLNEIYQFRQSGLIAECKEEFDDLREEIDYAISS